MRYGNEKQNTGVFASFLPVLPALTLLVPPLLEQPDKGTVCIYRVKQGPTRAIGYCHVCYGSFRFNRTNPNLLSHW